MHVSAASRTAHLKIVYLWCCTKSYYILRNIIRLAITKMRVQGSHPKARHHAWLTWTLKRRLLASNLSFITNTEREVDYKVLLERLLKDVCMHEQAYMRFLYVVRNSSLAQHWEIWYYERCALRDGRVSYGMFQATSGCTSPHRNGIAKHRTTLKWKAYFKTVEHV